MATPIPPNQAPFSLDEVLAVTGGELVRRGPRETALGVSTDTRSLRDGNAFVALSGPSFDGHAFLGDACARGAALLVVSREVDPPGDASIVRVNDTLRALGELGRAHRRRWGRARRALGSRGRVVAVTGSAGKTTSCRVIASALEALAPGGVHAPVGNMNNAVGVPLVLLGLRPEHAFGVVEVGTNAPGEVAYAASVAEPDIGVLTLVACAHAEGLGSLERIAREKGSLLEAVPRAGVAVANGDDPRACAQLMRSRARRAITYGKSESCEVRLAWRRLEGIDGQRLGLVLGAGPDRREVELRSALLGEAGAYAVAAALGVAVAAGARDGLEQVAARVEAVRGEAGRLRARALGSGTLLLDDCYNANPASMAASIDAAAELARSLDRPLVLVLGEMRELGAEAEAEHDRLGEIAACSGASRLVAVGGRARRTCERAGSLGLESAFSPDARHAARRVLDSVSSSDVVLVKGSRGVALERVVEALGGAGEEERA
jgi:UDP-N-acetylmuramoyl-tripeptide--D-alanyl-D-alanine ligase